MKHGKHLINMYRMNEFLKLRQENFQRNSGISTVTEKGGKKQNCKESMRWPLKIPGKLTQKNVS